MMNLTNAEKALLGKIGEITGAEVVIDNMRLKDGKPFQPKSNSHFIKVFIDYSGSVIASLAEKNRIRHLGIMSLQVFSPLNSGTLANTGLCDKISDLLQGYSKDSLEVYIVHAPRRLQDANFYGKIMRAEFRVN